MPLGTNNTTVSSAGYFVPEQWSDEVIAAYKAQLVLGGKRNRNAAPYQAPAGAGSLVADVSGISGTVSDGLLSAIRAAFEGQVNASNEEKDGWRRNRQG